MITVKGTQTASESSDPAAAYARKPEEKPAAVTKVTLLLISLVLAFKAFLSGRAEADQAPAEQNSQAAGSAPQDLVISHEQPQALDGQNANVAPADAFIAGSFGIPSAADSISYASAERQVLSPVFQPTGYIATQANENEPPKIGAAGLPFQPAAPGTEARGSIASPGKAPGEGQSRSPDILPPTSPKPTDSEPDTPEPGAPEPGNPDNDQIPEEEAGSGDSEDDAAPKPTANQAPRLAGPVFLNDISGCTVLTIGLAELLRGAIDPDGDVLAVEDVVASSGTLTAVAAGLWEFSPEGELGPVKITYRISDGSLEVDQTLHFAVVSTLDMGGTDQDDILIGTMCADDMRAGAGDDLVDALAGNDIIRAGAGDDHVLAGAGDDLVAAGAGDDIIFGGAGDDEIQGGSGNDRLFGEAGDDLLVGGGGDDMLRGGVGHDQASGGEGVDHLFGEAGGDMLFGDGGDDIIEGGEGDDLVIAGSGNDAAEGGLGNDRLMGGSGNDRLSGGAGEDVLLGEAGNDILIDGAGEDLVWGGEGDDRVFAASDGDDDRYDGGGGIDLLDYSASHGDLEIDLLAGHAKGLEIGCDTISGFERIVTGSGDDLIRIGGGAASVSGGEGCNTFQFVTSGTMPTSLHGQSRQTRYEIEDFKVGDRLRMSQWELFDNGFDRSEDMFGRVYGSGADDDHVPIRYRNEWADAVNETLIEADLDGDDFYETIIILDGRHSLMLAETA